MRPPGGRKVINHNALSPPKDAAAILSASLPTVLYPRPGLVMPYMLFETLGAAQPLQTPIEVRQTPSRTSALAVLALLLPALMVVLVPFGSLAICAGPALALACEHPGDAALALGGVMLFGLLFGLPAARLLGALSSVRTLRIEAGCISIADQGLFGRRLRSMPLTDFSGLAHRVRTNLSWLSPRADPRSPLGGAQRCSAGGRPYRGNHRCAGGRAVAVPAAPSCPGPLPLAAPPSWRTGAGLPGRAWRADSLKRRCLFPRWKAQ